MNFVAMYWKWREDTGKEGLEDYFVWLVENCHVNPGDVMTEGEVGELARITNTDSADLDDAMMAFAWP